MHAIPGRLPSRALSNPTPARQEGHARRSMLRQWLVGVRQWVVKPALAPPSFVSTPQQRKQRRRAHPCQCSATGYAQ